MFITLSQLGEGCAGYLFKKVTLQNPTIRAALFSQSKKGRPIGRSYLFAVLFSQLGNELRTL